MDLFTVFFGVSVWKILLWIYLCIGMAIAGQSQIRAGSWGNYRFPWEIALFWMPMIPIILFLDYRERKQHQKQHKDGDGDVE